MSLPASEEPCGAAWGTPPADHEAADHREGPAAGSSESTSTARSTNIYDIGAGDVWWTASDVGWFVEHSYIVYGPLLAGATSILYEGKPVGTPDSRAFWRLISDYGVRSMFTAPTAIRAIRKADPNAELLAEYNASSLRSLFAAGERLDPDTYEWATAPLGVPVIDHWWQPETGWAIAANLRGLDPMPVKAGAPTVPVPGFQVQIVDGGGVEAPAGRLGIPRRVRVCLRRPGGDAAPARQRDEVGRISLPAHRRQRHREFPPSGSPPPPLSGVDGTPDLAHSGYLCEQV